jgi:hypothetical protein
MKYRWISKLPRKTRGNKDQAYFTDLQKEGKKNKIIKLLMKVLPREKKRKTTASLLKFGIQEVI